MRITTWALRRRTRTIAALAVAAALTGGAAAIAPHLSASTHHTATRAGLASNDNMCTPSGILPVTTTGGILPAPGNLPVPGNCPGTPGVSTPQVPVGQQGQQCQLTEAQQQELVARAQDQQAANDLLFQSTLLKNLLSQAALKAGSAALSAQLSGKTGLSPQDVASLIQNGAVTPADMAAAILQTLSELGESSGDTAIDTCAGIQGDTQNVAANSSSSGNTNPPPGPSGNTPPADLGPDWVPADPSTICQSTGCEDVAIEIQQKIGGTRYRIEDSLNAPYLGKYRGEDTFWSYHEVDYLDGYVYDNWTGRNGEPIDQYIADWQYGKYLKWTPIG
jgi:hypothetical protein